MAGAIGGVLGCATMNVFMAVRRYEPPAAVRLNDGAEVAVVGGPKVIHLELLAGPALVGADMDEESAELLVRALKRALRDHRRRLRR